MKTSIEIFEGATQAVHVPGMLTPSQVRAARALLRWSRTRLAKESGVPYGTITDFENDRTRMMADGLVKLARAFDKAGVELFYDGQDGKGAGVRFKRPESE
jgi:transcriptional regulator with XRE-family HTH domain